jgi:hypothetical protein
MMGPGLEVQTFERLKLAAGIGIPEQFRKAAVIAAGVVLLLLAVFAAVKMHDRRVVKDHEAAIQKRAAPATDKAATERANDTIRNDKSEQEMHDVIAKAPDQPIAPTSRAHGCEQLRRAGRHNPTCP